MENQSKQPRFSQDQYDMLKRCSKRKDMTEWNQWRKDHPSTEVWLEGKSFGNQFYLKDADLHGAHLEEATFIKANMSGCDLRLAILRGADMSRARLEKTKFLKANLSNTNFGSAYLNDALICTADLENAGFGGAHLDNANFSYSVLKGAFFDGAFLQGALFEQAIVDGITSFWNCKVDRKTDFRGVGLDNCRVDAGTKQLLQCNNRRMNWEDWYKYRDWGTGEPENERGKGGKLIRCPVRLFWAISDYGRSTGRIVLTFFGLAIVFALVYWLCPKSVMVNGVVGDIRGFVHALYFSVVTMTTLGFGDIAANPDSWGGQVLLMVQVILGYVLLGALVTRFAVLFTAGGPAGKFAKEKGWFVRVKYWLKLFVKLGLSVLGAGLSYTGWLAYSIPVLKGEAQLWLKAACWLSAPLLTGLGFALPIVIFERLAGDAKEAFFRTLLWPVAACAVGAAAVFPFGPMLIVFSMFMAGTGAVVLREVLLYRKAR